MLGPFHVMAEAVFQTGGWINWSKGQVLGARLTVSVGDGQFWVALLALFVRSAESSVWNILRFLMHRGDRRVNLNGLYHQQQATTRNNPSDAGTLGQIELVLEFERGTGDVDVYANHISIFHFVVFTVAGIFSSRVVTTKD